GPVPAAGCTQGGTAQRGVSWRDSRGATSRTDARTVSWDAPSRQYFPLGEGDPQAGGTRVLHRVECDPVALGVQEDRPEAEVPDGLHGLQDLAAARLHGLDRLLDPTV